METGKKLIMVIKKKKNYFPRNVGENMKEKKDRILFNYFIIGFEIFIIIILFFLDCYATFYKALSSYILSSSSLT